MRSRAFYVTQPVLTYVTQNDDKSSIWSGAKPRVLMEFPWKLATARQCRAPPRAPRESILFNYVLLSIFLIPLSIYACILYSCHSLLFDVTSLSFSLSLTMCSRYCSFAVRKIISRDCQKYALRNYLFRLPSPIGPARSQDEEELPSTRRNDWKYSAWRASRWISKSSPMWYRTVWHFLAPVVPLPLTVEIAVTHRPR